jgi:hypothetical protein
MFCGDKWIASDVQKKIARKSGDRRGIPLWRKVRARMLRKVGQECLIGSRREKAGLSTAQNCLKAGSSAPLEMTEIAVHHRFPRDLNFSTTSLNDLSKLGLTIFA